MKSPFKLFAFPARRRARPGAQFSEDDIEQALEHVVDGTDPHLRLVAGYKKKLRDAVATSLVYIDALIEKVPGPHEVSRKRFVSDPQVNAFFATPDELQAVFSDSRELRTFFEDHGHADLNEGYALLCMDKQEKSVLGMELNGEHVQREVAQTAVNFSAHKVLSPAQSEHGVRQGIKQCIFDGLITHALQYIAGLKSQKRELEDQRRILHARLRARQEQGSGLSDLLAPAAKVDSQAEDLDDQLARAERELKQIPASLDAPRDYLNKIHHIFNHPEDFIRLRTVSLRLSKMGIKIAEDSPQPANTLCLAELEIANVLKRVVLIVRYPRNEMLPRQLF